MRDLFVRTQLELVRLELPEADVRLMDEFIEPRMAGDLFKELRLSTNWCEQVVQVWGKKHVQPRLIAWHGDSEAVYSYSGSKLKPNPWTPALQNVRIKIERLLGETFNSVLLNLYRNNCDRMGWHSDNEKELGPRPIIASLSLGETRDFLFKHKTMKNFGTVKVPLASGSLLVMAGSTQDNWLHAIAKESKPMGERINLTFRRIKHTSP